MENAKNKKSVSKRSKYFLIFGFLFFVNPAPMGFDLLPDVFGCLLLYFGLTQLSFFDGAVENARKNILYLGIVEGVRLFSMYSIATAHIGSNRLLGVTAFSIVEGILYFVIFKDLFGGIEYFAMRNNCNKTLAKCGGTAFLSYLAFFVRLGMTLAPELLSLLEIYLYNGAQAELEFDTMNLISGLLSAKPILILLVSLPALVAGIAWFISIKGLVSILHAEGGEELDNRYSSEYTSHPEIMRPKQLRRGSYGIYLALAFCLDIAFDGIRIVPFSAMFLVLFVVSFLLKGIGNFKKTRMFALPSFAIIAATEVYRRILVPYGAITIYETDFWIVAVGAVMALTATVCSMLCVRFFLSEIRELSENLGGSRISTTVPWVSYCVMFTLWAMGFVIPYFYPSVASLRFFAAIVFIWQTSKIILFINDEEFERASLYGPGK